MCCVNFRRVSNCKPTAVQRDDPAVGDLNENPTGGSPTLNEIKTYWLTRFHQAHVIRMQHLHGQNIQLVSSSSPNKVIITQDNAISDRAVQPHAADKWRMSGRGGIHCAQSGQSKNQQANTLVINTNTHDGVGRVTDTFELADGRTATASAKHTHTRTHSTHTPKTP